MADRQEGDAARGLHRVSNDAIKSLDWKDLAAYIDSLNDEYQWFLTQINDRKIGAHVPKIARPLR